jgi:hypothetical protein
LRHRCVHDLLYWCYTGWFYYRLTDAANSHHLESESSLAQGNSTAHRFAGHELSTTKSPFTIVADDDDEDHDNENSLANNSSATAESRFDEMENSTVHTVNIGSSNGITVSNSNNDMLQDPHEIGDETDVRCNPDRNIIYTQEAWKRRAALTVAVLGLFLAPFCLFNIIYFS